MQLTAPIIISSRLLPAIEIGGAIISIGYSNRPGDAHRTRYKYYIDLPSSEDFPQGLEEEGEDLQTGSNHSLQSALESLLSFLSAAAESYRYCRFDWSKITEDDIASIFPRAIVEWAYQYSDELSMAAIELEENLQFPQSERYINEEEGS